MAVSLGAHATRVPTYRWVHGCGAGVLLVDAGLRGTAAALTFGRTGWLGGITVLPEHRGTGLGAELTEAAAAWLVARGCESVLLHATEVGARLYERLGWEREGELVMYDTPPAAQRGDAAPWEAVRALDALASGEDRSVVLRAGAARVSATGASVTLPWGSAHAVGDDLHHGERWILPAQHEAPAGWTERARVARMRRGAEVAWRPDLVRGAWNLFWG
jgi:hypothetical protein